MDGAQLLAYGVVSDGYLAQRMKATILASTFNDIRIGLSHKNATFTTYIFNAGWTDPTMVLSLGFSF
jgi:hypothetical protein